MRIATTAGERIPLNEIADYSIERGDVAVNHLDGRREVQISADLKNPEATSSTDILEEIRTVIMPEIIAKYPTVTPSYEGQNREAGKFSEVSGPGRSHCAGTHLYHYSFYLQEL